MVLLHHGVCPGFRCCRPTHLQLRPIGAVTVPAKRDVILGAFVFRCADVCVCVGGVCLMCRAVCTTHPTTKTEHKRSNTPTSGLRIVTVKCHTFSILLFVFFLSRLETCLFVGFCMCEVHHFWWFLPRTRVWPSNIWCCLNSLDYICLVKFHTVPGAC